MNNQLSESITQYTSYLLSIFEQKNQPLDTKFTLLIKLISEQLFSHPDAIGRINLDSIHQIGLEIKESEIDLNPSQKQACILLNYEHNIGLFNVVFCKTYRGFRDEAIKKGVIKSAIPTLVYSNDTFEWNGHYAEPLHKYNPFIKNNRGDLIGSYCIAKLTDDSLFVTHVSREELDQCYLSSVTGYDAWNNFGDAMLLAKTIKLSSKYWPGYATNSVNGAI